MFWVDADGSKDDADINVVGTDVAEVKASPTYISETVVAWFFDYFSYFLFFKSWSIYRY